MTAWKYANQETRWHQKELQKINLEILEADRSMMSLGPSAKKSCRSRPTSIVTPEVAAAQDRTRISNRNATYVLAAAA